MEEKYIYFIFFSNYIPTRHFRESLSPKWRLSCFNEIFNQNFKEKIQHTPCKGKCATVRFSNYNLTIVLQCQPHSTDVITDHNSHELKSYQKNSFILRYWKPSVCLRNEKLIKKSNWKFVWFWKKLMKYYESEARSCFITKQLNMYNVSILISYYSAFSGKRLRNSKIKFGKTKIKRSEALIIFVWTIAKMESIIGKCMNSLVL